MRRMIPDNKWKEVKNATEPLSYNSATRVLTVDSDLQMTGDILVADEDQQSVKKIYCHPIQLNNKADSSAKFRLTCLIFNNSNTPFTLATFKDFIDTLKTATSGTGALMLSGAYYDGTKTVIVSRILKNLTDTYSIGGLDTNGNSNSVYNNDFDELLGETFTEIYDGVNPIN